MIPIIYLDDISPGDISWRLDDIRSKLLYGCLETLVLAVLAKEPLHGYALKWTLAEKSKYHVQPGFGRLYPLPAKLDALFAALQHRAFRVGV